MLLTRLQILGVLMTAAATISAVAIFPSRAWGQSKPKMPEHRALWVAKFAAHAKWHEDDFRSKDLPFVIGILGDDPEFNKEIEPMKLQILAKRRVEVKPYKDVEEVVASRCQVLFICKSEYRHLTIILKPLRNLRVLTISEVETISDFKGVFDAGGVASLAVKQTGYFMYTAIPELNPKALSSRGGNWEVEPVLFRFIETFSKFK